MSKTVLGLGIALALTLALSGPGHAAPVSVAVGNTETLTFPAQPETDGARDGGQLWLLDQPDVSLFAAKVRQPWLFKPLRWLLGDNFLDVAASDCGYAGAMSVFPPGKQFGDYILGDAGFDLGVLQGFHTLDASFDAESAQAGGGAVQGKVRLIAIGDDLYFFGGTYRPEKEEPADLSAFLDAFQTKQTAPASTMTADEKGDRLAAALIGLALFALVLAIVVIIVAVRLVRRLVRSQRPALDAPGAR